MKKINSIIAVVLTVLMTTTGISIFDGNLYSYSATKAPKQVKIKSIKAINSSETKISWKKVTKNCNEYVIARSRKKSSGFKVVGNTSSSSYKDKGLEPYTTYYYKVRAVNKKIVKQWQGYNEVTEEWFDIPNLDSWVGGNYEPRQIDKEVKTYGKYSKVKSVKTKKKKIVTSVYECIHEGDTVYFSNGYTLFTYDINTKEIKDTGLSAYSYMLYDDGYIYIQPHSGGIGNDMPIFIIDTNTMKETSIKNTGGHGFAKVGDEVLFYNYTKTYLKKYKGTMFTVEAYNVKTKKKYSKNKYTLELDAKDTNDADYYVETTWDDEMHAYLHTPEGVIEFSGEWNVD